MTATPVAIILAFAAGVLTVLSPCTLPVVPVALAVGGTGSRRRLAGLLLGFAAVFVTATVLVAAAMAAAGLTTSGLRTVAVLALAITGIALAVPTLSARLVAGRTRRGAPSAMGDPGLPTRSGGFAGGLALGAATGLIWAPCTGPIMAGAIVSAATLGPSPGAVLLASAYVIGALIPLAAIGLAGRGIVHRLGSPAARARAQRAFGVMLIASAVLVGTGLDVRAGAALADVLPASLVALPDELGADDPEGGPAAGADGGDTTMDGSSSLPAPLAASLPAWVELEDLGTAPELTGITAWLNSQPLTLASLRGKVVLVHFWTFGCINCIHVQPFVKAWDQRYREAGLVVVGVHTPELSFERDLSNVRQAVADADVRFPVAFDPDYRTWRAFENRYWPAFYFIDRSGHIRHVHAGEGDYDGSEQVIRELLAQTG